MYIYLQRKGSKVYTHRIKSRQAVGGALPPQEELLWGVKLQPNVQSKLQTQKKVSRRFLNFQIYPSFRHTETKGLFSNIKGDI